MKKRVLILLAVAFVSCRMMANDGDTFTEKITDKLKMTYTILSEEAKTCELKKVDGSYYLESLTVPATASGYTVTKIGNRGISSYYNLHTIALPTTLTEIGEDAFYRCTKLVNINIPSGVTTIGKEAFHLCSALVEIELPATVTTIGYRAFSYCENLQSINIPEGITEIAGSTFENCKALKHIDFPSTLKAIRSSAFYSSSMETAILPEGVETIEDRAFFNCPGLQEISIPSTVTSINNNTFEGCSLLMKATLNCPVIGKWMQNHDLLKEVILGSTVRTIEKDAFQGCYLQEVELPEGLTTIGNNAFYGNKFLTKLTISSTVTKIGSGILQDCSNMETLVLKCPQIPKSAFQNLTIKNLFLDGVIVIGETAFDNCESLEEVDWGSTLKEIGLNAFRSCKKIYKARLSTVKKLGIGCFRYCSGLLSVDLPSDLTEVPEAAFEGCNLLSIDIPKTVTVIHEYAFEGCANLEEVVIPEGVTHVWDAVFNKCTSLKSISFPSTMVYLGQSVCANNVKITDVYCYMTTPDIKHGTNPQFEYTVYQNAKLHIPSGTYDKYKDIYPWKNFKNVLEMGPIAGNGDANGNGEVDDDDVDMIKDFILGNPREGFDEKAADLNGDGKVNAVDVVLARKLILQKQ